MVPVSVLQAVACAEDLRELSQTSRFSAISRSSWRWTAQTFGRTPACFKWTQILKPIAVAGVPPDYFAADGQLWGNPLYDWEKHKATNYAWWLARLRASFALYDVVRVDHFRGFDQYCKIPANATNAREYEWVPGPGLDLFESD